MERVNRLMWKNFASRLVALAPGLPVFGSAQAAQGPRPLKPGPAPYGPGVIKVIFLSPFGN